MKTTKETWKKNPPANIRTIGEMLITSMNRKKIRQAQKSMKIQKR
jgi:uncharacterized protein YneF (UPF0154 family)